MSVKEYPITALAPTVTAVLHLPAPGVAAQPPIPEIVEGFAAVPRVAVLVLDAVGLAVWRHWREQMPFLTSLHAAHHLALRAVSPPITPVNFAAIVTGVGLETHRVSDRYAKLGCESIFDVVRGAGGQSLGAGQPTFTGGEFLARYSDLPGRAHRPGDEAVEILVSEEVRAHRPIFAIAQLGDADTIFHHVGPVDAEAEPVIRKMDARLSRLTGLFTELDYGVLILADHGMHPVPVPGGKGRMHGSHDGSGGNADFLVPCTWTRPL